METKGYAVSKLTGENYFLWKLKIQLILQKEKIWSVITKDPPRPVTEEWDLKDQSAMATIGLAIDDKILTGITGCKTAKEIWIKIKNKYEHKGLTSRIFLLKKLYSTRYDSFNNMEDYLNHITELSERLRAIGETVKDHHLIALMICGLPENYNALITSLEAREDGDLKIEYVAERLRDEAIRHEGKHEQIEQQDLAMRMEKSRIKNSIKCHLCGKEGHVRRNCTKANRSTSTAVKIITDRENECSNYHAHRMKNNPENYEDSEKSEDEDEISLLQDWAMSGIEAYSPKERNSWVIDSGATTHMTGDINLLYELKTLKQEIKIITANGETLIATQEGKSQIFTSKISNTQTMILDRVLYVPEMTQNLMSVTSFCESGCLIFFDAKECRVYNKNKVKIVEGERIGKTYVIQTHSQKQEKAMACIHKWHNRLGHRDRNTIEKMKKEGLVKDLIITPCTESDFCNSCQLGKMAQKTFSSSNTINNNPFTKILTDLCGPINPCTFRGFKYFITITDDASNYTEVNLLKNKSEAAGHIIGFVKRGYNRFKFMPTIVRSDGGGEYLSKELQNYFTENGIIHQTSVPRTPQQNGKAERKNRTLLDMARCMMKNTKLPLTMWGEAILTATYLHNRIMHSKTKTTPYENWFNKKPSVKNIRTFGCKAFAYVPRALRGKFGDTSIPGYLVGYGLNSKSYRIWLPGSYKVINAISVNFDEREHSLSEQKNDSESTYLPSDMELLTETDIKAEDLENNQTMLRRSSRNNKGIAAVKWTY